MGVRIRRLHPKKDGVVDVKEMDLSIKFAAAKAFPSVVGILCRHIPYDMAFPNNGGRAYKYRLSKAEIKRRGELVFWSSGIIYECHREDDDCFSSIIICAANLFVRTDGVQPPDIQVDVCLWDGKICQGRVIACDFHYNLAAIRIQTPCQLPTPTLRHLDDFVPLNLTPIQQQQPQQQQKQQRRSGLLPHSTKFKISPGTPLITISRSLKPLNAHSVGSGDFSTVTWTEECDYSELYWVQSEHPEEEGGAVINYRGEFIGLMFYNSSFLPFNLVSAWWKNFKTCRQYHRPCIGMKIANLHATGTNYLTEVLAAFPDVTGGVVVTEAAEDSTAYDSGIRCKDVIVKCDGKLVRSSLELFEIVWNKVGIEYVELEVWRASNGDILKPSLKVEQTSPDKIYQWEKHPWKIKLSDTSILKGLRKRIHGEHVTESKKIRVVDKLEMDLAAKASPWLVSIISHHVPDDMAEHETRAQIDTYKKSPGEEIIFQGSGIIVECEQLAGGKYSNIIFTAASLFERTNGVLPHQVKVDVYLSDGKLFKGRVIACDFHYNLAAIRIVSYFPIQTATFTALDDTLPIYPTHRLLQLPGPSSQMFSHSNLFKIVPGTKIIRLVHSYQPAGRLSISSGVFSDTSKNTILNCNELYWVKHANANVDKCGGPVMNCSGEVIGIGLYRDPFLPVNIVSRWWEHFKSCGEYCRPWLGVEVANLYSSNLEFLEHFMMKFPNISTGVVVAEVAEDSPASCSGIRPKDVIVECNGKVVSSKLQFFDVIWDMVGESVEFNILRESTGKKLKLPLIVGDTTPDKFYKWRRPDWIAISKKQSMLTVTPDDYVSLRNPSLDWERIIE